MSLPLPVPNKPAPSSPSDDDTLSFLLLGLAGGALVASRRRLPGVARGVATVGGLALMGFAAFRPMTALLRGAGTRRRGATVRMSFIVSQPVERVFGFCRDFENYPRFVGSLRSVRDFGDGRSRWCASTPGGSTLEWSAVTTKYVPNRVIAWETVPGSPVHATGLIRFKPTEGRTCLEVTLSYEVLEAGPMREALAALVAPPRRHQLEADIRKLAHYLDTAPEVELTAYGV
ncbi:MAG: hypothetical protein JWN79_3537 [Gemmatimonadetes bacterium]|jgi:uncharacterized membrane protein|nr:hypothetical protein [Gemmatimonadota bacterium]